MAENKELLDIEDEVHPHWDASPDYHFFWGGPCSQWAVSPFKEFGETFNTAEQFMMAAKAKTFGDEESFKAIMDTNDPHEQKGLGRNVKNFDSDKWNSVAREYVTLGNYNKFTQNPEFKKFLIVNIDKHFVEASPHDKIWGIGMRECAEGIDNPANWKGSNWLGQCINRARDIIVAEMAEIDLSEDERTRSVVLYEIETLRDALDWR
jgi:ribA/ribD-fused uncharacterized protein